MNKIFMLATANIRKSKGYTISLGIMLIIAAMMFNLGLLMLLNYNTYFDKTVNELSTSDSYITVPYKFCNDNVYDFVNSHTNVKRMKSEYMLPSDVTVKKADGKEVNNPMVFFNNEINREITKKKFIGEYLPLDENSIYLGYYFNIEWKYKLGDTIKIDFGKGAKEYTIKGFVEDIYYAAPNMGMISGYFSGSEFQKLFETTEKKCVMFYTDLYDDINSVETDLNDFIIKNISTEIRNDVDLGNSIFCIHLPLCKLARIMLTNLIAVMLVALAMIVVIICMIVIRFRIKNSIEEDMTKIGSLKAVGYTSKQIIGSIIFQFVIVSAIGSLIGITLSYTVLPAISDVLAHQSALKWEQSFDLINSIITLVVILIFVALISFTTARKIRKLNPIIALRGGIATHSFRKNYLPLDKSAGSLSFVLGMKSIFQNIKQSLMIFIITISVSFVGVYGLIMFYNTSVDTTTFAETAGVEICNISVMIDPIAVDNEAFLNEILQREGIEFAQYIASATTVTIDGLTMHNDVMKEYSQKRTVTVYEGRYPIHDNEISINGNIAKLMGKKIGDTVSVKGQADEKEYLITGFQQGANFGGLNSSMTYSGYIKLFPDFKLSEVSIYLEDNADTEKCLKAIIDDYGDKIISAVNVDKEIEEGMGRFADIISMVGVAVLSVSLIIIILVLYFVLNSLVIRQRRTLGIQKAIGFTTIQLMNQMTFSVMPSIIIGIAAGSALGALAGNPIMSVVQSGMGIVKANYIIKTDWIIVFSIAVAVISYLSSMLITSRIHRISAYALVTE